MTGRTLAARRLPRRPLPWSSVRLRPGPGDPHVASLCMRSDRPGRAWERAGRPAGARRARSVGGRA
jgi:hypothetical protein